MYAAMATKSPQQDRLRLDQRDDQRDAETTSTIATIDTSSQKPARVS